MVSYGFPPVNEMLRTTLNAIAMLALLGLWLITGYALFGAHPLPPRIPTHFDLAGHANGWGRPGMLWLVPGLATLICGLMTLVARRPQSFNYPVRVTPGTRPRMQAVSLSMIAWLRAEIAGLFFWIQFATIRSAQNGTNALSPWFVPLVLVVVLGTIGWHFASLLKAGRRR